MPLKGQGPFPGGAEGIRSIIGNTQAPMSNSHSGEITVTTGQVPMGMITVKSGNIKAAYLAVTQRGIDSNTLSVEADVRINGTSIFTTKPKVAGLTSVGGGASTVAAGTGITQAVIGTTVNKVYFGDRITRVFTIVRTASPTNEIANPTVVIELEPTI
jgi:hypothetical protein